MATNKIKDKKVIFVSGIFNVLHPGHIRMFRLADELGTHLIVGLQKKSSDESWMLEDEERFQALKSISLINDVQLIDDLESALREVRPDIVLKGREHKNRTNIELDIIKEWGGRLIFSSGESKSNSLKFLSNGHDKPDFHFPHSYKAFARRHNIVGSALFPAIDKIKDLKIAVVGDIILDEYVDCDPVGLSREDPTIVVTPTEKRLFIGGAAIVALHAKSFGAAVDFYSVSGDDENADWLTENLVNRGISCQVIKDESRPTTIKRRYRSEGKTLLRVNDYRSHSLQTDLSEQLLNNFESKIAGYDVVIFSDFSYGLLHGSLVNALQKLAREHNVSMVADSQTSSQRGDLSKFKGLKLATPTELEARLAADTMDNDVGLAEVIGDLANKIKSQNLLITLGAEGAMILDYSDPSAVKLDSLPALNKMPVDVSGAGDLLMVSSALFLETGCNLWESSLLGMLASSIHISKVGNSPIDMHEFRRCMEQL